MNECITGVRREFSSVMSVDACVEAKTKGASEEPQPLVAGDVARPHEDNTKSNGDSNSSASQRNSSRARVPTRRLVESSLKDSTRFFLLKGRRQKVEDNQPSSPSPANDEGSARKSVRRKRLVEGEKLGASGSMDGRKAGREKRRRSERNENFREAGSRPRRTAAVIGEAKREMCMEKLLVRGRGRSAVSGSRASASPYSRAKHGRAPSRSGAARRPVREVSRRRTGRQAPQGKNVSRNSRLTSGRLRQIPVVKSDSGSKTRLLLSSKGASGFSGKRTASGYGKHAWRGEDGDDESTGSSSNGVSEQSFHRKDWGLMEVDAVGRNRPPFARTLLYHGTVPFPLPADLCDQTPARNWVIKRWSDKGNRRRIDQEVHECIKAHPHPYLVRILDVSPSEGVLME